MSHRRIRLAEETIERAELAALGRWLLTATTITKGPLTEELEHAVAARVGAPHALFVNSGSAANLIAIYALMQARGWTRPKVVAPAVSWVTTVTPAIQLGAEVHLCDCDEHSLGLDIAHLEELLERHRPDVVIAVHVLGHGGDMERIADLCARHGAVLLEDACEAFGSVQDGRHLGTLGVMGTYSCYYGHQISTIEGGFLVTADRELLNIARSLRAHGWVRDVDADFARAWEEGFAIDDVRRLYSFHFPGFNCRSTDLNAFLGLSQLNRSTDTIRRREENFSHYQRLLDGRFWTQRSRYERLSSLAYGTLVADRSAVCRHLGVLGIETRPLICGSIGRQPFWIKRFGAQPLAHADVVHDHGMYLPNHPKLAAADIEWIAAEFSRVATPYAPPGAA